MEKFKSVDELVNQLKPVEPVYCIRPTAINKSVDFFKDKFPGEILYAVKTNPNKFVLDQIYNNGIKKFDVASINEIRLIHKNYHKAKMFFMHTVKAREDIYLAYKDYGIKDFALDTKEELQKILEATNNAKDLTLYVRVAISNEHAEIDLSRKFGALPSEALGLIRLCKYHAEKIGVSFHVGSQCMHKISFSKGISEIKNLIKKTKIIPDIINVGGGFPSIYPDLKPEPLVNYINEIKKKYIEVDEYDQGVRNIFNYGHSFGHAIESATKFKIPHGIAVTIGMDMANRISAWRGTLVKGHYERMHDVLRKNYKDYLDVHLQLYIQFYL